MKTVDFIREHNACHDVAKWALSISDDMAVVWNAMIEQNRHAWLLWAVTRPGVFTDSTLRKLACRFVRETPVSNGRTVWDLLTDERSRKAIEVTEAYVDGNATKKELVAAAARAADAAAASYDAADAAGAYAAAAYAAASASRAASAARAAVCAVGYVARAAADAARAAARAAYWDADAAQVRMVAELGNPFKEENPMSTNKHTPGPWKTQTHISLDRLEIRDADGRRIAECAMDFPMSAKTHDANASLIAAAPELLAALEAAREFIADGMAMGFVGMPEDENVLEVIEKAIRKSK